MQPDCRATVEAPLRNKRQTYKRVIPRVRGNKGPTWAVTQHKNYKREKSSVGGKTRSGKAQQSRRIPQLAKGRNPWSETIERTSSWQAMLTKVHQTKWGSSEANCKRLMYLSDFTKARSINLDVLRNALPDKAVACRVRCFLCEVSCAKLTLLAPREPNGCAL